jgi:hypothetical protein
MLQHDQVIVASTWHLQECLNWTPSNMIETPPDETQLSSGTGAT